MNWLQCLHTHTKEKRLGANCLKADNRLPPGLFQAMIHRPWAIGKAHDAPSLRLGKLPHDSRSTDLGLCTFAFVINLCNANVHMLHRNGIKAEEDKQFANIWNKCELEYNFFCCVNLTNNYVRGDVRERAWATFLASCGCLCQTVRPADLVRGLKRPGTVRWTLFIAFVDCKSTIPDLLQCKCERGLDSTIDLLRILWDETLKQCRCFWMKCVVRALSLVTFLLNYSSASSSELLHINSWVERKLMNLNGAARRRTCVKFPTSSFCRCQNAHTASLIHPM